MTQTFNNNNNSHSSVDRPPEKKNFFCLLFPPSLSTFYLTFFLFLREKKLVIGKKGNSLFRWPETILSGFVMGARLTNEAHPPRKEKKYPAIRHYMGWPADARKKGKS